MSILTKLLLCGSVVAVAGCGSAAASSGAAGTPTPSAARGAGGEPPASWCGSVATR